MKKILLFSLLVILSLFVACNSDININDHFLPYFEFEANGADTMTVTVKNGATIKTARVPEQVIIDDTLYTVTEFGGYRNAEDDAYAAKLIYLPDTVTSYVDNNFTYMFNLDKVVVYETENALKQTVWPDIQSCPIENKRGYDWDAWYSDKEKSHKIEAGDAFAVYSEAHPIWEPKKYDVTFDPNGGFYTSGANPTEGRVIVEVYDQPYVFPEAGLSKEGLFFAGWFTDPVGGTQITASTLVDDEHMTLYAHYEKRMFKLTLVMNGGELAGEAATKNWTEYQGNLETALPANPVSSNPSDYQIVLTKDKTLVYKHFAGWYTTPDFKAGTEMSVIPVTQTGTLKLYAKWENHHFTFEGGVDADEKFLTAVHTCACGSQHTADADHWDVHLSDDKTQMMADCTLPGCDISVAEVYKGFVIVNGYIIINGVEFVEGLPAGSVELTNPEKGKYLLTFTPTTDPKEVTVFVGSTIYGGVYTPLTRPDASKFELLFEPTANGKYRYTISVGNNGGNTITFNGCIDVNDID